MTADAASPRRNNLPRANQCAPRPWRSECRRADYERGKRHRPRQKTWDFLTPKQKAVIEEVLSSSNRVHGLQVWPGLEKRLPLKSSAKEPKRAGAQFRTSHHRSKAASALQDAGIEARTLQSLFASKHADAQSGDQTKHLDMLDESSLASSNAGRADDRQP